MCFLKQTLSLLLLVALAQASTKLSNCKFLLDDGSVIDLSSLDNATNPFSDESGSTYYYKFNPCSPLKCADATDSAICQGTKSEEHIYDLGDQQSSKYDENQNTITYQAPPTAIGVTRKSIIHCECSVDQSFTFLNEDPAVVYNFNLKSPCCCKNGCQGNSVKKLGPCSAQLGNGSVISLKELDHPKIPLTYKYGKYDYQYNPCSPLRCDISNKDAAFCQKSFDSKQVYTLGEQASSSFSYNEGDFLVIEYKSLYRTSNLICICSQVEDFDFVAEFPVYNYTFVLYSNSCCAKTYDPNPTKLGSCKAKLSDGSIIDLSSLDNPNNPRKAQSQQFSYSYNPCSPIQCNSMQNSVSAAVCQFEVDTSMQYDCGDQDVMFSLDTDQTLLMSYKSNDRESKIRCVCNEQGIESFNFIDENPLKVYNFEFKSKCCCPNGC